jgi:DASS family divalent anion:Na+ symporter
LFLPVVAIAVLVTRFLIVDMATCYSLFILVLLPVCREYGISPWLVGMASYVVVCQVSEY